MEGPSPNNQETRFVRNEDSKEQGKAFTLVKAFKCAGSGILYAFRTQRNMKIHLGVAALALVLGFAFGIDAASWLAIVICIGAVMAAECANTAIESVVDLVSPGYHELARWAKDCAAGSVYLLAITAVVVACIIFIPRMLALLGL